MRQTFSTGGLGLRNGPPAGGWLVSALLGLLMSAFSGLLLSGCQGSPAPTASAALTPATLPPALRGLPLLHEVVVRDRPAEIRRLHAGRRRWVAHPLGQLLVNSRIGWNYTLLGQPDSSIFYLRRATHAAAAVQARHPLQAATVASTLGYHFYQLQTFDSSRYYYRRAIGYLAGQDTVSSALLDTPAGPTVQGVALASYCANAGLSDEARGDLPTAVRYYTRAARLYDLHHNWPGRIWAQTLLADAYAAQGTTTEALAAYESILELARRYERRPPVLPDGLSMPAEAFVETLNTYQPLLLRLGRTAHLARLLTEAEALTARTAQRERKPAYYKVVSDQASLALSVAALRLRTGLPATATEPLARADAHLTEVRRHSHITMWMLKNYYGMRVEWLALRARQAHALGGAAQPLVRPLLRAAQPLLDSIGRPAQRMRTQLQLATHCLSVGEPALAIRLLRPLVSRYQRTLDRQHLRDTYAALTRAYVATHQPDSAYAYEHRLRLLTDTLRATRQYATLTEVETRYRTQVKEARIVQLTERATQQTRQTRLAWGLALLLTLGLTGTAAVLRLTRRLNHQLAHQRNRIQEQADALATLDEAKNQFFANVSHELRTPLTLILGPLDQVLAQPTALAAAPRAALAMAARNGHRLRELVDRLLDLTKLQAGKLPMRAVPTALAPLVRRLGGQFASLADHQLVALRVACELADEVRVLLDADKVEQIITNLLANALTHTPAGGEVTLEAEKTGPDTYALTVRDTGPGIAPTEQARVFERFYQSPQRQAQGGTGLGLALSRELAELLGGTLTLASGPGTGAAFTLHLTAPKAPGQPLAVPARAARPAAPLPLTIALPAAPAAPTIRPARLLLVEDHADLRAYLRSLLEPQYHVLEAPDGRAALDLLLPAAPAGASGEAADGFVAVDDVGDALVGGFAVDLVITDAMMPHLSGIELLEHLRAHPATRGLPVLMLTARADEAHRLAALEVGVDDYLTKPFQVAELLARVRALVARHRVRQQYAALPPGELLPPEPDAPADDELTDDGLTHDRLTHDRLTPDRLTDAGSAAEPEAAPDSVPPTLPDGTGAELLRQWRALVAPHLTDERFGPADLARALALSERTLYRRLHELAGLTPAGWLRELRLAHARRLLETRACATVAEVAFASGFASASHFGRVFAERFGRPPGEYLAAGGGT